MMKIKEPFVKITVEDEYGTTTVTATSPEDETCSTYIDIAARALMGAGFHYNSVKRGMAGYLEEHGYFDEKCEGCDAAI